MDRPFHVAQLVSGVGINGAIRHCYELTCELALQGCTVTLVHRPDAWIGQQEFPEGVELIESTLKRKWHELKRVAAELRNRKCDVLHTHMSSAHFFGVLLARLFRMKSVATCHMPLLQPHWWWNDRIIAPCGSVVQFQRWMNAVPLKRIDKIPNFINPSRFRSSRDRTAMRAQLEVPNDAFVVGVVGSVDPRKGMKYLIEALPILSARGLRPWVVSAGPVDESYMKTLQGLISQHSLYNQMRFLGRRNDVADLMMAFDCVALPSKKEVMPISLMESMAVGLPVIATAVGGIPEFVRDGVDGFVVPPRSPKALAEAISKWMADPQLRTQMGRSAKDSMAETYSPTHLIPHILTTYRRAAA
ncbi:MAG: glycosyltransferase family 4 protein [Pirellulales bacterium]